MNKNLFKTRKVLCLALAFVAALSLSISATGGSSGDTYDLGGDTENVYNTGNDTSGGDDIIFDTEVEFGFSQADDGYYEIRTIEDYNSFMIYVSAKPVNADTPYDSAVNVRLMNDLTIPSGYSTYPIGTKSFPYTGTFDGNNRYIAGLYVPDDSYSYVSGLFGVVSGTIKNLEVRTSYFGVKGETGAICAIAARNATISNCEVWLCSIATSSDSSNSFVGGLVGVMDGGRIENCTEVYNRNSASAKTFFWSL